MHSVEGPQLDLPVDSRSGGCEAVRCASPLASAIVEGPASEGTLPAKNLQPPQTALPGCEATRTASQGLHPHQEQHLQPPQHNPEVMSMPEKGGSSKCQNMAEIGSGLTSPNAGCTGVVDRGMQLPMTTIPQALPNEDALYLKKNNEHLRSMNRCLEGQIMDLEERNDKLEQRKEQYKALYEQAQADAQCRGSSGELEITNLHQQLSAIVILKDHLNSENMELQKRLEAAQKSQRAESRQAACVICMDNLANVVCLPCKHLAICAYCGLSKDVVDCPICRTHIQEKMQIYIP